ncbi:MAG: PKD domain-containing protein [Saprospiraceae bacterium]|nr:PKD domain-containing protein [Saprospiraceae bacterium]MBK8483422.1 PKD domain-containing protein [Saprospiraceae bacterium]MBK9722223.1 PKD domain-containing protein [Saprospiraceae bacterium]MBK9729244.1 PKD domain-containing protein [Saprospiraceae bacterium]
MMNFRLLLNVLMIFVGTALYSQSFTFKIIGTVYNTDKKTVADWPVTIVGDPTTPSIKLKTDGNGNYEYKFSVTKGAIQVYQIIVEDPCQPQALIQKAEAKEGIERHDFVICTKSTPGGNPCDGKFEFVVNNDGWVEFHAVPELRDAKYYWNFGDGQNGEGKDVKHQFSKEGVYVVTLTIATPNCKSQFVAKVEVKTRVTPPPPPPSQNWDNACCGKVHINAIPSNTASSPNVFVFNAGSDFRAKEVSWDFGDGETATGIDAKHVYAKPGKYLVTTTITGEFCKIVLSTWIHVNDIVTPPPPKPCDLDFAFSTDNLSAKFRPDFKGAVPDKVRWEFGDGAFSSDQATSHTYAKNGEYKVTLFASINGVVCQITKVIKVGSRVSPPNPTSIVIYEVSPNPAIEDIMVSIKSSLKTPVTLVIADISNAYLAKQAVELEVGDNKVPMKVKDLKSGTYIIYLYFDNNIVSRAKFQKI